MNFSYLQSKIRNNVKLLETISPVMSPIDEKTCPFYFPVYVKDNRKELQRYLASEDIYATVIWAVPEYFINKTSDITNYIYNHILCFHVDQRYTTDDMGRIVESLVQYYSN